MSNASDSKETLCKSKSFLKVGTISVFCNNVINHMKVEESVENKNGWWNAVILESIGERLEIITVHRTVDSNTKSINSFKD